MHAYTADVVCCGCDSVDELLCGGLREGHLTELFGESASGKTQVSITGTL